MKNNIKYSLLTITGNVIVHLYHTKLPNAQPGPSYELRIVNSNLKANVS